MVFGDRVFGGCWSHGVRLSCVGLVPLSERLQREPSPLPSQEYTARSLQPGRGPSPGLDRAAVLISWLLASRTERNTFLLFVSCSVCSILSQQPEWTKIAVKPKETMKVVQSGCILGNKEVLSSPFSLRKRLYTFWRWAGQGATMSSLFFFLFSQGERWLWERGMYGHMLIELTCSQKSG